MLRFPKLQREILLDVPMWKRSHPWEDTVARHFPVYLNITVSKVNMHIKDSAMKTLILPRDVFFITHLFS